MKILTVGDVVGNGGTAYIQKNLWRIRKELQADFCVLNGENAANGNGLDKDTATLLLASGADVITTGNHVWKKHSFKHHIDDLAYVLRPYNYPTGCAGEGAVVFDVGNMRILTVSMLGNVYMPQTLASPFACADSVLKRYEGEYDLAVFDIHAEATSEKAAFAKYLDGRAAVVFGTHTHVQTNDATVLSRGTGFVTDIGMVGVKDSILGVQNECVLEKFLTQMPVQFNEPQGEILFCGAVFDVDEKTGKCVNACVVQK